MAMQLNALGAIVQYVLTVIAGPLPNKGLS